MKKIVCAIALAAAAIPSMAMAQEETSFNGFYAGAVLGFDHIRLSDGEDSSGKDGFAYGGVLGYDANLGGAVVGLEAEIGGSTAKETWSIAGETYTAKAGRDIYIGARLGAPVTPRTLLYVKGGYANGRVSGSYNDGQGTSFTIGDNLDGWRLGAGVEQSFGRFGARLEYRYTDYSEIKINDVGTGIDAKRHQVVASLIARF